MKKCPWCAEEIQDEARICRFCGRDLAGSSPTLPQVRPPQVNPEMQPQSRRGWLVLGAVIFAAIVAAAAFISFTSSGGASPKHSLIGTFTLNATSPSDSTGCHGTGGYGDIVQGLGVIVKDGDGKTLGVSNLGRGTSNSLQATVESCMFPFQVDNLPEVPFYSVEIGRRGALTYPLADVKARGWTLEFSLGK